MSCNFSGEKKAIELFTVCLGWVWYLFKFPQLAEWESNYQHQVTMFFSPA